jgi:glyoxylase-like metal-dependent hydrolase (beta-lactamase superfamily II)
LTYDTVEDFFGDIIGKARRGKGLSERELAEETGLSVDDMDRIESYALTPDRDRIVSLADALGLNGEKLCHIAEGWVPANGNDPHDAKDAAATRLILDAGMQVNCYLLACKRTGKAAIVDPGGEPERILSHIESQGVAVTHILLTHGHGDHIGALSPVKKATGGKVYCGEGELSLLGGRRSDVDEAIGEAWSTQVGSIDLEAVSLAGHTPGGIGFGGPGLFFSGDALFAGSLGGAQGPAYEGQIRAVAEMVLHRDGETRIFPGHGPITTVAEERQHNPFFDF